MARLIHLLSSVLALTTIISCTPDTYGPLPSEAQLEWADMEYYMFCHFGPNTFSGLQWGIGDEDPDIFAPTELDCEQWVRTAIAAGMKGIIVTAKHHDGFCLWPSEYSSHTVAQSSWRNGRGDVLAELRAACDKYDFPMGVYISPWDRNHPTYGTPEYNEVFANTVAEVHRLYGPMFEQWFDGANGGARIPDYDWPLFHRAVYENSPNAVIFSDVGPGCRWVGNENGLAGETNWCRLTVDGFTPGAGAPGTDVLFEGQSDGTSWVPAECDVPIRADWFYNDTNVATLKSVGQLMDIWMGSVGHGGNLILNVAPDTRGLIPAEDSLRLMEFRAARESFFGSPVASCGRVSSHKLLRTQSSVKSGQEVLSNQSTLQKVLRAESPVKCIVLQEDIRFGQKVKSFVVEYSAGRGPRHASHAVGTSGAMDAVGTADAVGTVYPESTASPDEGQWITIASGTTIGHKRIVPLTWPAATTLVTASADDISAAASGSPVPAGRIRVRVTDAFGKPRLTSIVLY